MKQILLAFAIGANLILLPANAEPYPASPLANQNQMEFVIQFEGAANNIEYGVEFLDHSQVKNLAGLLRYHHVEQCIVSGHVDVAPEDIKGLGFAMKLSEARIDTLINELHKAEVTTRFIKAPRGNLDFVPGQPEMNATARVRCQNLTS